MPYVKNPFGRIVEVEEAYYNQWLGTLGFSQPSPLEVKSWNEKRSKQIQQWKEDERRVKETYGKPGVYFVTVTQGGKDGYGVSSKLIYEELQKLGVNISFGNEGQKIALLLHAPYSITRLESPVRILYTMFESTKIPDDWADYLDQADRILVPSRWCQEVFRKSGIETEVVPLGYDDNLFKLIERKPKRPERGTFTFLHYNAFNIRKGFTEVFKAFVQEFQPDEPVKMIFKTTLDRMPIPILEDQYPNIEIITGQVPDEEFNSILARSDCFVFPSRGEGFGIPPLEAMATGLPTIVPNAHGISEYFNENFMYEVKVDHMDVALYTRYKAPTVEETKAMVGEMYVSSIEDLRKQMRYVYEHEEEALAKGRAASFYVKNWTFKKTAEKLKGIIDEMSEKPEIEKPLKNVLRLETLRG